MIGHLELEGRDLIINTEGSAILDGVEMVSNGKLFGKMSMLDLRTTGFMSDKN